MARNEDVVWTLTVSWDSKLGPNSSKTEEVIIGTVYLPLD